MCQYIISYPPCKKGIRPGICVKPAVSHEAGGRVRYDWLNADTRLYPFFTRRITNLSSAPPPAPPPHPPPPPQESQHTCIVGNGPISQWDLMGKINIMQSGDKTYVIYTQLSAPKGFAKFGWQIRAIGHKENEKSVCQTRVRQAM